MKMSKYSTLLLELLQVEKATVEKRRRLAGGAHGSISHRQIFWSGGCKNSAQPMSPEIAGFFDTGKYNWESGYKFTFLFMAWVNILLRSPEQLWKSRMHAEEEEEEERQQQLKNK